MRGFLVEEGFTTLRLVDGFDFLMASRVLPKILEKRVDSLWQSEVGFAEQVKWVKCDWYFPRLKPGPFIVLGFRLNYRLYITTNIRNNKGSQHNCDWLLSATESRPMHNTYSEKNPKESVPDLIPNLFVTQS